MLRKRLTREEFEDRNEPIAAIQGVWRFHTPLRVFQGDFRRI